MGVRPLPRMPGTNFARCVKHHQQLRERGVASERCLQLATHFAPGCRQWADRAHPDELRHGAPPHEETSALLATHGVQPGYDGRELRVGPSAR